MNFITFLLAISLVLCFFTAIKAEEECLYAKINCYECNSRDHLGCGDPFNATLQPPSKMCHGCCVKIVSEKDTPSEYVRRTCTKEIDINLFIVDHVCMEASNGQGNMCFCESTNCNSSIGLKLFNGINKYVILFLIICSSILMTNMYNDRKF